MSAAFHKLLQAPARLKLCAALMPLEEADFRWLREHLEVSDSVLSKHLSQLEHAGFVTLAKSTVAGRRRTLASLTAAGRRAFAAHVAALQELIDSADASKSAVRGDQVD